MIKLLVKIKNIVFDILFPPLCLNCRETLNDAKNYVCEKCLNSIQLNSSLFCPVCRRRLADNKKICHHANAPQYLLAPAGNYDDEILRNLIYYFKYKYFQNLTPFLGEILIKYLYSLNSQSLILNSIVVPVPLHRKREKERGFNQAKILGEYVARKLNLEFADVLEKTKNNKPQAQLKNNEERIKNMEDCFKIKNNNKISGKNIILIDDVFTTGATINEAVKILKQNNAKKIIALTLAKA